MKSKVFNYDSGPEIDEAEINKWLDENPNIKVQSTEFAANDNRFIFIVFYTENTL
jgi:hypothetical protein